MLTSTFVTVLSTVIVLGSIGNIISIIVWRHGKRSKTANCKTYMWSLALNDLFLLSVIGTEYALTTSGINIRARHIVICKSVLFCGLFSPQVSAWITVAIAMERMLYVCVPIKMYKSNVKKRSVIILVIIVLFSLALNITALISPKIITYNDSRNNTMSLCTPNGSERGKGTDWMRAISYGIFTFLFPLLLITLSNCLTLITVCARRQISRQNLSQQRNISNITKIVTSISVLHCISTFPYAIFLYNYYIKLSSIGSQSLFQFISISYLFNSGFNVVLYCLFGKDFRQDLRELVAGLFKCCKSSYQIKSERSTVYRTELVPRAVSQTEETGKNINQDEATKVLVFDTKTSEERTKARTDMLEVSAVCQFEEAGKEICFNQAINRVVCGTKSSGRIVCHTETCLGEPNTKSRLSHGNIAYKN